MNKEQFLAALAEALKEEQQVALEDISKQAVIAFPEEAFGYFYLAEAMLLQDIPAYPKAEILLAKAIQLEEEDLDLKLRFAAIKEDQGLSNDAIIIYSQILAQDAFNFEALKGIGGNELYGSQNSKDALDYLKRAVDLKDNDPTVHAMIAECYSDLGDYDKALEAANEGLDKGFNANIAVAKLTVLEFMDSTEGAADLYQELLKEEPENFAYRYNFARILFEEEDYAAAEAEFKKALAIMDDGNPLIHNTLGEALLHQGKYDEAIEKFNQCIETDKEEPYYFESRSDAKLGKGDLKGALEDLKQAIDMIGDDPILLSPLIVKEGLIYYQKGDVPKAKALFKSLAANKETRAFGYYGLGVLLHKEGEPDKAYKVLKLAKLMSLDKASKYIDKHLSPYLDQVKTDILNQQSDAISQNAQSAVVSKLSGKLWKFKDLNSKKMEAYEQALQDKIKETLDVLSMVFTERGLLFVNEGSGESLTYKIKEEKSDQLDLEFILLDGDEGFGAQIKVSDGQLSFSKEADEWLILEEQDLKAIPKDLKNNFKEVISKDNASYLGKMAAPVLEAIY